MSLRLRPRTASCRGNTHQHTLLSSCMLVLRYLRPPPVLFHEFTFPLYIPPFNRWSLCHLWQDWFSFFIIIIIIQVWKQRRQRSDETRAHEITAEIPVRIRSNGMGNEGRTE